MNSQKNNMKITPRIALWSGLIGSFLLPALSSAGYFPVDVEYLFYVLISLASGTFFACISFSRFANEIARVFTLSGFSVLSTTLYFGRYFAESTGALALAILLTTLFIVLAFRAFDKALLIAGVFSISQILTAAATTPSHISGLQQNTVTHSDTPSVLHLLLDAHGGIAAIPPHSLSAEQIQLFQDNYVKRGFIIFTHAYTLDSFTPVSVSRMLNPEIVQKKELPLVDTEEDRFLITAASSFKKLSSHYALDVTHLDFLDLRPALKKLPHVSRILTYEQNIPREAVKWLDVSTTQRIRISLLLAVNYLYHGARSPLLRFFFTETNEGKLTVNWLDILSRAQPLASRFTFHEMTNRLTHSSQRGMYYFAHLVLPHPPYIFDNHCTLKPLSRWADDLDLTVEDIYRNKSEVYKHHFEQMQCAQQDIFLMLDALEKRKETADAVVFLHSDHGTRMSKSKIDMRGSFIALKIPGMEGGVIDVPVRLDALYNNLIENNFKTFDLKKIPPDKYSPYR